MTEIKTYLKLDGKEIDTPQDFADFLNIKHEDTYKIEVLEPIQGVFLNNSYQGGITSWNGLHHTLTFKILSLPDEQHVMLNEIHRNSIFEVTKLYTKYSEKEGELSLRLLTKEEKEELIKRHSREQAEKLNSFYQSGDLGTRAE